MSSILDGVDRRIGLMVKLERDRRAWSIEQLAALAGVSKATISRIERAEGSASASLLVRVANALDMTLSALLASTEASMAPVSRRDEQPVWTDPETGYERRQIFAVPDHGVEVTEVTLPGNAEVTLPTYNGAAIRQIILVIQGEVEVCELGERVPLGLGDCLAFGQSEEVSFGNRKSAQARYLIINSRSN